ncbi:MAG: hypothetical protein WC750_06050 [Patescibacteria group bacterium]
MQKEIAKPGALNIIKSRYEGETAKATLTRKDAQRGAGIAYGRFDVVEARKNAAFYKKNLEKVSPETLLPGVKDTMWRRAKALKDEFVVGMLSREELHPVRGFQENGKMVWVVDEGKMQALNSVERNRAWLQRNEPKIREFKNLMRHLCPENPNAGDIERFRPKGRGKN